MKNNIFLCVLCSALLLSGCTENNTNTVSFESETVSVKEAVSSAVTEITTPTTTTTISEEVHEDPLYDHRPCRYEIQCDFVEYCKNKNEIYADDGTLLGPVTVEYPHIVTENKEVNEKINNTYIEFKNSILQGNTPFASVEQIMENYEELDITFNSIDSVCSELTYLSDKYISLYDYHMAMGDRAAHPIHAYTAHTFSLETGELLTIEDIFNDKFIHFAEKYISNDLESVNQRDEHKIFYGKSRDDIADKLKNNEWYLTPDGFTLIFAHSEISGYALGTFTSTIPWKLIEEYMKTSEVTIEKMDYSVKNDNGNVLAEVYYEKPVIYDNTNASSIINQYFENKYSDWLNDEQMKRFLETVEGWKVSNEEDLIISPFFHKTNTDITYLSSDIISILQTTHWMAGGVYDCYRYGYTFNLNTGELLPFTYFYDVSADDFRNNLYNFIQSKRELGGNNGESTSGTNEIHQNFLKKYYAPNSAHNFKYESDEKVYDISYEYYYDGKNINLILNNIAVHSSIIVRWNGKINDDFETIAYNISRTTNELYEIGN